MSIRSKHIAAHPQFNIQDQPQLTLHDLSKILFETSTVKILELGTKRSNEKIATHHEEIFANITNKMYIKTDYQNGIDVDVVCDLHKTEGIFEDESFDLIISCSTYEHLKYPHVCSLNLIKMLNINGFIFIQTHQTFPLHGY